MVQSLNPESTARSSAVSVSKTGVVTAAVAAILLGVTLIVGAGFASPGTLHNAAHDSRHAFAFPCH